MTDNIIQRDGNCMSRKEIRIICNKYKKSGLDGDILNIGTYSGWQILLLNKLIPNKNIVTVDYITKPNVKNTLDGTGFTGSEIANLNNTFKKYLEENNITNIENYTKGSNSFFKENNKIFDLIIIDGDHSRKQSQRDLNNSLNCVSSDGIIVMHDIKDNTQGLRRKNSCAGVFDDYKGHKKKGMQTKNGLGFIWLN